MISFESGYEYKTMLLGLDRIKTFLSQADIKYDGIKYIHIAGTNGKGSTAKILSEILISSGYKTGLYTSPHLIKINERIQINSKPVSDSILNILDKKYNKLSKKCKLTFFEHITALAFAYFVQQKVDIAVLETGLGGRFDATNIITPLVSVITSISLDHTEILGKNLKNIAFEKAGIIKKTVPVICGNMHRTAFQEIEKQAKLNNSAVYKFNRDFSADFLKYDWKNYTQKIKYTGLDKETRNFSLSLLGQSQIYNAAVALCVCQALQSKNININSDRINEVCANIKWHARFDIRKFSVNNKKRVVIIDGAHNMQAIENFLSIYKKSPFADKKNKLLFAIMKEKKYKTAVKKLTESFSDINLVKVNNSRAVSTEILKKEFAKYIDQNRISIYENIEQFFNNIKNNLTVICVGSFYLAGNIIKFIEDNNA